MAKPSYAVPTWADNGDIVEPSSGKKEAGWLPEERPPAEFLNWWQNRVGGFLAYLADAWKLQLNFFESVQNPTAGFAVEGMASNGVVHYITGGAADLWFQQGNTKFWTATTPSASGTIRDIAYAATPDKFAIVTETTNGIYYFSIGAPGYAIGSPGTLSYTLATYVGGAPTVPMRAIHWEESIGLGVAVGGTPGTGPAEIYTSTDFITWTKRTAPGVSASLNDVRFANGAWIAVGVDTSGNEHIIRSTDAITWSAITLTSPVADFIDRVAYNPTNNTWLVSGYWFTGTPGQLHRIWTSTDNGLTWTNQSANTPENVPVDYLNNVTTLYDCIYDEALGGFIVSDDYGLYLTADGTSFTRIAKMIQGTTPQAARMIRRVTDVNSNMTWLIIGRSNTEVLQSLAVPTQMG